VQALDVDDMIAHLLVHEGFSTVDELVAAAPEELGTIEGFDAGIVEELQARARNHTEERDRSAMASFAQQGGTEALAALEGLSPVMLVTLVENGVRTLDDLGDLATDELLDLLKEHDLSAGQAEALIMGVRQTWFQDGTQA
jgi:N utilization substance protein A